MIRANVPSRSFILKNSDASLLGMLTNCHSALNVGPYRGCGLFQLVPINAKMNRDAMGSVLRCELCNKPFDKRE